MIHAGYYGTLKAIQRQDNNITDGINGNHVKGDNEDWIEINNEIPVNKRTDSVMIDRRNSNIDMINERNR